MKLKEWRIANRYSQHMLAQLVGLKTGKSIYDYENGTIPKKATIKKIEKITDGKVTLKDFYS